MKQKSGFIKGLITGLVAALVIVACVVVVKNYVIEGNTTQAAKINTTKVDKKVGLIEELINKYYLNDIDTSELTEGIYAGMLEGLNDPYSVYYTAEEYKSVQESVSGTYSGIGVTVTQDDKGNISVVKVNEDGPGQEAGLQAGDIFYEVDGESVEGMDLSEVVAKIKGEAGTKVTITVYRDGKKMDFTATRKDITVQTIDYKMLDNSIGYIYIGSFDTVTYDQFKQALTDLQSQNAKSIIFDVRDNPGGSLTTVVDMLDLILPKGLIVYTEDKNGKKEEETSDDEHQLTLPVAVLVNENSASASEIFSGAIKDYGLGPIVGKTTFGKGVVQTLLPLSDGSAVKLTIANYYTPKGNSIQGKGVVPDYEVDIPENALDDKVLSTDEDTQLQKAIELLTK